MPPKVQIGSVLRPVNCCCWARWANMVTRARIYCARRAYMRLCRPPREQADGVQRFPGRRSFQIALCGTTCLSITRAERQTSPVPRRAWRIYPRPFGALPKRPHFRQGKGSLQPCFYPPLAHSTRSSRIAYLPRQVVDPESLYQKSDWPN
jgi:hypothetical protein